MLIVQKFGGTSLAGPEAVGRSARIIAGAVHRGARVAAVLSAQGSATDELIAAAGQYSPDPPPREMDMLLSTGEQASVALMAMTLARLGVEAAVKLDAVDIDEMLRLSAAGARVLHVRSVALARRFHVPLEVLSSMADVPGTRILPLPLPEDEGRITALAADGTNVTLVGTHMDALPFSPGQRAADALSRAGIGVAAMVETDGLLSVRPEEGRESEALRCLHREFFE